jgi:uncharacterized protein (TIGR04145 family)
MKKMKKIYKTGLMMSVIFTVIFLQMMFLQVVCASGKAVILDGNFDDWVDKPSEELKYNWNNPGQVHTVKWYTDDKNLYLYIKMGVRGGQQINYYQIFFYINNGEQRQMAFYPENSGNSRICVVDTNGVYNILSQDGYVVRGSNSDGATSDQAEFRIPLSTFQKYAGNEMFNLKLKFPNLGEQYISFEVGSTYPYAGITLCSLFTIGGLVVYSRNRRVRTA